MYGTAVMRSSHEVLGGSAVTVIVSSGSVVRCFFAAGSSDGLGVVRLELDRFLDGREGASGEFASCIPPAAEPGRDAGVECGLIGPLGISDSSIPRI